MTSREIGVQLGRSAAMLGRLVGASARVVLPLLLTLLVLSARLVRRTTVLLVATARSQLAAPSTARRSGLPPAAPRLARR